MEKKASTHTEMLMQVKGQDQDMFDFNSSADSVSDKTNKLPLYKKMLLNGKQDMKSSVFVPKRQFVFDREMCISPVSEKQANIWNDMSTETLLFNDRIKSIKVPQRVSKTI